MDAVVLSYELILLNSVMIMNRIEKAIKILRKYEESEYIYLGEGYEGVIFHNGKYVFKVFIPKVGRAEDIDNVKFALIKSKAGKFKNKKHLIDYEFFTLENKIKAIRYKFEEFEKVTKIDKEETISFLTECWQEKIVFRDVKFSNFIRVNGVLRYIDYGFNGDFTTYTDNLFENMAVRMFIDVKYPNLEENRRYVLKRSSINNFTMPELEGFKEFLNKVFSNIVFEESSRARERYMELEKPNEIYDPSFNDQLVEIIKENMKNKDELTIFVKNFERINFEYLFWKLLNWILIC